MTEDRFGNQEIDAVERALAKHVEVHAGHQTIGIARGIHHFEISLLRNHHSSGEEPTREASVAVELNEPPTPSMTGLFSFKNMRTMTAFGSNCI